MKCINNYIFEKLRINKNTNFYSSKADLLNKIYDIIINCLKDEKWLNYTEDDFKITYDDRKGLSVILRYPEDIVNKNVITDIGLNIAIKIKKELHVDWAWMLNEDEHKLIFSDDL